MPSGTRIATAYGRWTMATRSNKRKRPAPLRVGLGFSPAQTTASGAGGHGGSPAARNRRDRGGERRRLRSGDWD
jgi:hypothetical protein